MDQERKLTCQQLPSQERKQKKIISGVEPPKYVPIAIRPMRELQRISPALRELHYLNILNDSQVNLLAPAILDASIQSNVAGLSILMENMSPSWQKTLCVRYFLENGLIEFAGKFSQSLPDIPPLHRFESYLPPQENPTYNIASMIGLIQTRLPNYYENAYVHADRFAPTHSGILPVIPFQIFDPHYWPHYFPEMVDLTEREVADRIESMITKCFDAPDSHVRKLRELVKIKKDQVPYGTGSDENSVTELEEKYLERNQQALRNLHIDLADIKQEDIHDIRLGKDITISLLRWLSYMVLQAKGETTISAQEMQDIEIHAQNQLIQVFYDLHQKHGYSEEQVKNAFRFFVHDLGILSLGEQMGIAKSRLLSQLGGVYAPIEAYFALRSIDIYADTQTTFIRSAVSEDEENQVAAAQEDRYGIDMVIIQNNEVTAYGQVKGLINIPRVYAATVPSGSTGIDILDKHLYPNQVTQTDRDQCVKILESVQPGMNVGEFIKLMKLYYKLNQQKSGSFKAGDMVVRALFSADKIRKSAGIQCRRQRTHKPIEPFFMVAPSKIPD